MSETAKVECLAGDGKDMLVRIEFDDGTVYEGWVDKVYGEEEE